MKIVITFLLAIFYGCTAYGQQDSLYGHVFSYEGEARIGATIIIRGTTTGTVTDLDGSYQLPFPGKETVYLFSDDGYRGFEVKATHAQKTDVILRSYHEWDFWKKRKRRKYQKKYGTTYIFTAQLLDRHNQPLANTPIQVESRGEQVLIQSDAKGWFTIKATVDALGVVITHPGSGDLAAENSGQLVKAEIIY